MPVDTRSGKLFIDGEEMAKLFKMAIQSEEIKMFFQEIVEKTVEKNTEKLISEINTLKEHNLKLQQKLDIYSKNVEAIQQDTKTKQESTVTSRESKKVVLRDTQAKQSISKEPNIGKTTYAAVVSVAATQEENEKKVEQTSLKMTNDEQKEKDKDEFTEVKYKRKRRKSNAVIGTCKLVDEVNEFQAAPKKVYFY